MTQSNIAPARKKNTKTLLSMMNKQNQQFIPIAKPLVEMMVLVTTDDELDYLLQMGTGLYDYQQAVKAKSKRKTIPINTTVSSQDSKVYPTFDVNDLIEEYGDQNAIYVFLVYAGMEQPLRFAV